MPGLFTTIAILGRVLAVVRYIMKMNDRVIAVARVGHRPG